MCGAQGVRGVAHQPRRHAPGGGPHVLLLVGVVGEGDVEGLREVLAQKVRGARLERPPVLHERLAGEAARRRVAGEAARRRGGGCARWVRGGAGGFAAAGGGASMVKVSSAPAKRSVGDLTPLTTGMASTSRQTSA